jgi:L-aspartate oxidase
MNQHFQHDVLVIGSGAAGLTLALTLPARLRIAVLSKGNLANGSTYWAQGGMPAPACAVKTPRASPWNTAAKPSSG